MDIIAKFQSTSVIMLYQISYTYLKFPLGRYKQTVFPVCGHLDLILTSTIFRPVFIKPQSHN